MHVFVEQARLIFQLSLGKFFILSVANDLNFNSHMEAIINLNQGYFTKNIDKDLEKC